MSDVYNFGEGGSGSDYYQPQYSPFGQDGYGLDERQLLEVGIADAIWRNEEARRAYAASQADQSNTYPVTTDAAAAAGLYLQKPVDPEVQALTDRAHEEAAARQLRRENARAEHAQQLADLPLAPTASAEQSTPPAEKPRRGGLVFAAVAGIAVVSLGIAAGNTGDSNENASRANSAAAPAVAPNFSCDVAGIAEQSGTGTLHFREAMPAGYKVRVMGGNAIVGAQAVAGDATQFTYPSEELHNATLSVTAQDIVCAGQFSLGSTASGDEHFQAG
jgi:hypothetical protein